MNKNKKIKVLFVCLGNICRSPLAQGIFEQLCIDAQLEHCFYVDSAGTAAWHAGKSPDRRSIAQARQHRVDISQQQARQCTPEDFSKFDYIWAMDKHNLQHLEMMRKRLELSQQGASLALVLDDAPAQKNSLDQLACNRGVRIEVPDPYYGAEDGFALVYDLLNAACKLHLNALTQTHNLV